MSEEQEDMKLGDVWRHALTGRTSVVVRDLGHTVVLWNRTDDELLAFRTDGKFINAERVGRDGKWCKTWTLVERGDDDGKVRIGDTWRVGDGAESVDVVIDDIRHEDGPWSRWAALGQDSNGRRYGFPLDRDDRMVSASHWRLISRAKPQEPAAPAFDAHDPKRVVRVGDVLKLREWDEGKRVEKIENHVAFFDQGGAWLRPNRTLSNTKWWAFCNPPQTEPAKPSREHRRVRAGDVLTNGERSCVVYAIEGRQVWVRDQEGKKGVFGHVGEALDVDYCLLPKFDHWTISRPAPEPFDDATLEVVAAHSFGVKRSPAETAAAFRDRVLDALTYKPKPDARTGPAPRCGQTWQAGVAFNTMLFEQTFTLVDVDDRGTFTARLDDGRRIAVWPTYFSLCAYVSGPTSPESPREAWERVVRLEAETPPDGCSREAWLAELVNRCSFAAGEAVDKVRPGMVRTVAANMRAEHAARWARFRGER